MARRRLLVFVVAYHAEETIERVIRRIPAALADDYDVEVLVIDDASTDETFGASLATSRAGGLPFKITVLYNPVNQGYGGNQKIGYQYAIQNNFDFVCLLHGDGQYAPEMMPALVQPLKDGAADAVFGSRMMPPRNALKGGMPLYKFVGNRILTALQNRLFGANLSEFHSGYRVYATEALRKIPFDRNTNDFHFDTEIIIQLMLAGLRIVEVPIPTYYGNEISRVNGLRYAGNVLRASLKARFQRFHLLYDRRFDCLVDDGKSRYPSKLEFDSTHSRVVELVAPNSRVLDLGSGMGAVGAALKQRKHCTVVGVDMTSGELTGKYDAFIVADLNRGIPDVGEEAFDYILALDVIEHLASPEDFLDTLRQLAARWPAAKVILTTGNVAFLLVRLSLLLGRFEYGRRGILDITHTRLFTFATIRRAMQSAGFHIEHAEGVVPPLPMIFGPSFSGRVLVALSRALARTWPTMFGFQCLLLARARPTLETLLAHAEVAADERASRDADQNTPGKSKSRAA